MILCHCHHQVYRKQSLMKLQRKKLNRIKWNGMEREPELGQSRKVQMWKTGQCKCHSHPNDQH